MKSKNSIFPFFDFRFKMRNENRINFRIIEKQDFAAPKVSFVFSFFGTPNKEKNIHS